MNLFGIELEFFVLDEQGYPALGSVAEVIKTWHGSGFARPPVYEFGSFQVELNPGPWPLTPRGIGIAVETLSRDVNHLKDCAAQHGWHICAAALIPAIREDLLNDPHFLMDFARYRATTAYFEGHSARVVLADGEHVVFPGETAIACINEIHIHVQLEDDQENIRLFNYLNTHGDAIWRVYERPQQLNGQLVQPDCTTMRMFFEANGEWNATAEVCRVGYIPYPISSVEEYYDILSTFRPIPCMEEPSGFLKLEDTVYFWVRLRGSKEDPRVEYRPFEMGEDWPDRVRFLAHTMLKVSEDFK